MIAFLTVFRHFSLESVYLDRKHQLVFGFAWNKLKEVVAPKQSAPV
jgi:hypothetical protein